MFWVLVFIAYLVASVVTSLLIGRVARRNK